MIKYLFFDLGSTLIDESECIEYRIQNLLQQPNAPAREVLERRMVELASQNRLPYKDAAKEYGLETIKWPKHLERVYEGIPEMLAKLKPRYGLGVIANQSLGTEQRLKEYGIRDYFDIIISSAEAGVEKPDPEIFRLALEKAGCAPGEAIMIGDRLDNDIEPAAELGMHTIWVKQGAFAYGDVSLIGHKPEYTVDSVGEVLTISDELESIRREKTAQMKETAILREEIRKNHKLRFLFFELTLRCNENCIHCGSRCGEALGEELPTEVFIGILDKVAKDFAGSLPMLNITGGEPLLRKDFFEIVNHAKQLGFSWGMTSNGTLISKDVARKLKEAGMATVSISLDGTKEYHEWFRRSAGSFERTVEGLRNLMEQGFAEVQVTTVVTPRNLSQLDDLFRVLCEIDVDSWRLVGMEPIGRALDSPELLLSREEQLRLLRYIRDKREEGYPVTYACSHWLGYEYEREVRDWYFLCQAGTRIASIMANGDIGACPDIERRPETIQGNVLTDDFTDVWNNRFRIFRTPLSTRCEECGKCPDEQFCKGGSAHTWDYSLDRQRICFRRDW